MMLVCFDGKSTFLLTGFSLFYIVKESVVSYKYDSVAQLGERHLDSFLRITYASRR